MRSIVSNEKKCLICETPLHLHKHHIFFGTGKRQLSEKYGCWCYLCPRHHNMSNAGVHFNTALDRKLKEHTQRRFNEVYPELDFLQIFGKNYLYGCDMQENKCVVCGTVIPEGRQVCPICEKGKGNEQNN